ncbi:hypothetical protein cyc_07726 [Cyclospora cayetanensis]|uniref:Uncharacterized protein n=1 Tax=Cyclospora cayetanensis TaxID=88456 RepID=A0A1D3CQR2_9EIME|nr:hypothetical protein cyc_07726 [Cyclospora cayetanensis]
MLQQHAFTGGEDDSGISKRDSRQRRREHHPTNAPSRHRPWNALTRLCCRDQTICAGGSVKHHDAAEQQLTRRATAAAPAARAAAELQAARNAASALRAAEQ